MIKKLLTSFTRQSILCLTASGLLSSPALAMRGGKPASLSDALAQVSVAVQAHHPSPDGKMRVSECTGVRIAADLILTAAHCLDAVNDPAAVGVFAYHGAQAVPPYAPVVAIARHPTHRWGWSETPGDIASRQRDMASDMALLKIGGPLATTIASIGVQTETSMVMGAGTEGIGSNTSGHLKSAALGEIRFTTSAPPLAFASPVKAQVCKGDSGGPIGSGTTIWGISGAILKGSDGCSARIVIVPVDPSSTGFQTMMREVRK
jgi:hypothetical protein